MLSCQQVSQLVSESLDRKLSLRQRMQLGMHLAMCRLCKGFSRDIRQLHLAARRQADAIENDRAASHLTLSPAARQRIKQALQRRQ